MWMIIFVVGCLGCCSDSFFACNCVCVCACVQVARIQAQYVNDYFCLQYQLFVSSFWTQKRKETFLPSVVCVCTHVAVITSLLCSALYLALKRDWGLFTSSPIWSLMAIIWFYYSRGVSWPSFDATILGESHGCHLMLLIQGSLIAVIWCYYSRGVSWPSFDSTILGESHGHPLILLF